MYKVCHFTSAHDWNDDRIYLKECYSLAQNGYEVYLVAEGTDKQINGINVVGCGNKPEGRKARFWDFAKKIYRKALELDCDIYHFHDPELLPYGIKLKNAGKKVIFDSHEDVPAQIMSKYWIPASLRWGVSKLYKAYESYAVAKFDAVITATPAIAKKFEGRAKKVVVINNYPRLDDIVFQTKPFEERPAAVCYAGGLDAIRGGKVMVEALADLQDVELVLAGSCDEEIKNIISGGANIRYLGKVDRKGINDMYRDSIAGLVLLKPLERYKESKPVKMYEYMAAGLPFICSDFPLWRELVNETGAGICVPWNNLKDIREAIDKLISDRKVAKEMGRRGRRYVEEKYSWNIESRALLYAYEDIL